MLNPPSQKRQAGAPTEEIEITPEMVEAGVSVLAEDWGVIGAHAASELAEIVFRAMMAAAPDNMLTSRNVEASRSG